MRNLRAEVLQWAVGIFCSFVGVVMMVAPHQFNAPAYAALQPQLGLWGLLFFGAGVALLATTIFRLGRFLTAVSHLFAGTLLLLLAYGFAVTQSWTGTTTYAVLGLGTLLALWLSGRPAQPEHSQPCGDLASLVLGTSAAVSGLLILGMPGQFNTPVFLAIQAWLPWCGAAFLISGAAVIVVMVLPRPSRLIWIVAHLLLSATFFAYLIIAAIPGRFWTGIAFYGGGGALLASLPWLQSRLWRLDSTSLRVRLTIALAIMAAVPLLTQATLITDMQEHVATAQALALQERLAGALSRYTETYIDLYRSAMTVLAARPDLLNLSRAEQIAVLRRYHAAYPEAWVFTIHNANGQPLARSDDRSGVLIDDLAYFQKARTTLKPAIEILIARSAPRPVIALGSPIQDANGQFAGIVTVAIETPQLVKVLARANVAPAGSADRIYLVDERGHVIAHPDSALAESFADISASVPVAAFLQEQNPIGSVSYGPHGNMQLAGYARVSKLGWGIVAERPQAAALASFLSSRNVMLGMLIGLTGAALLVGMLAARQLAAPLVVLTRALNRLSADDSSIVLPDGGIAEINQLSAAFNDLRARLAQRTAQRDQAEQKLREEHERLRVTLHSIGDAVIVTDTQGCVTYLNPVAEALTGWTQNAAYGRSVAEVVPLLDDATGQSLENPVSRVLRIQTTVNLADHILLAASDGRHILVEAIGAPLRAAETVSGVVLILHDMSRHYQLERETAKAYAQAEQERRLLETVMEALPVGVAIADSQARVIRMNAGVTRVWGAAPGVDSAEGYRQYKGWWADSGKFVEAEEWALPRAALHGETVVGQVVNIERFDGSTGTILNSGAPIRDEAGRLIGGVVVVQDITALKRIEDDLHRSEARFRWLIETTSVGLVIGDQHGRLTYCNPAILNWLGYTAAEVEAGEVRWDQLTPPEFAQADAHAVQEMLEKGTCTPYEKVYVAKDGTRIPILISATVLEKQPDGTLSSIVAHTIDLRPLKQIQAALSESEERYRTVVETLPQMIWTCLPDGYCDYLSRQWCAYTGIPEQEQLGDRWVEVLHPDDQAYAMAAWTAAVKRQADYDLEYRIRRADGVYRWFKTRGVRLYDTDGKVVRWFGSSTDIEDRKRAETLLQFLAEAGPALSASLDQKTIFQHLTRLIVPRFADNYVIDMLGADGQTLHRITLAASDPAREQALRELTERYPRDPKRKSLYAVLDSGHPILVEEMAEILLDAASQDAEHAELGRRIGTRSLIVVPLILRDAVIGTLALGMAESGRRYTHDDLLVAEELARRIAITLENARLYEQVRAHTEILEHTVTERTEELRQTLARAEAADRAKTRMLSNVSHEMRTPLSSIVGFSNLILAREMDSVKLREFITTINSEGRRLTRLVNDFLDLQRIESGREVFRLETVDLADLLREVVKHYAPTERNAHAINLNLAPVPPVQADSERMHQVVLNLLSNAVKYSPDGGTITVSLCQQEHEVICSVHDQGVGIAPDELNYLFERFQRGEVAEYLRIQGTGLGLALCREIIHRHNGRIWAESAGEGRGATFSFALSVMES